MPGPLKRFGILIALSAVLVAAAPSAGAARGGKDACELLKRSEIEEVLGDPAGEPEDLGDSCYWQIGDPEATAEDIGLVVLLERGSRARTDFREGREVLRPEVVVEIDDLGRDAYFAVNSVSVLKNKKTWVYLTGVFDQAQAEELVRIAVRRA